MSEKNEQTNDEVDPDRAVWNPDRQSKMWYEEWRKSKTDEEINEYLLSHGIDFDKFWKKIKLEIDKALDKLRKEIEEEEK